MIEVGRNAIIVRDVDLESKEFKLFKKDFSIWNEVEHKYDYSAFELIDNDIHAPATIGQDIIQSYFPKKALITNYMTSAKADNIKYNVIHQPRTDDGGVQISSLEFLKDLKNNPKTRWKMLTLKPGSGKTYVSIATISHIGQKAMIIVDTKELAEQWKSQFLYHTDMQESDICLLSGMASIEEAKTNANKYKVFIAIYKTLGMLMETDANAINSLSNKLKIGIRVFDECHENFHNACMINSLSNVNYTIYLTATPARSDHKENSLFKKVYKKVKSYDGVVDKSIDTRYHTVFIAYFNSHPTDAMQIKIKTKYGFSAMRWAGFMKTDECFEYFRYALMTIIRRFGIVDKNVKTAIMLPTIDLIDMVKSELEKTYPDLDVGKYVGSVKGSEARATEKDKRIILTNLKMFGKGIDVPDLDCIINTIPFSSKPEMEQLIGRLRNNDGHTHVLFDLADYGFKETKQKQKSRITEYRKIAKEVKLISKEL